jgi:hypothetical protein
MSKKTQDLFEIATLAKLRYTTTRGEINTEDLWDVPLRSKDSYNLEVVAQAANEKLRAVSQPSFVPSKQKSNPKQAHLALALEVIQHIISVKFEKEESLARAEARRVERNKLLDAMAEKNDAELKSLSKAELRKRLDALDAEADAEIG